MIDPSRQEVEIAASLGNRFKLCREGVAGIEFALALPVLLIMVAGAYDISAKLMADRKGQNAASTLAALMGNESKWTKSDVDDLLAGGAWLARGNDTSDVKVIISVLDRQADGSIKVSASRALNSTPLQVGASPPVDVPTNIQESGTSIIMTQVKFSVQTPFSNAWPFYTDQGTFSISDYYFQRPRRGGNITID